MASTENISVFVRVRPLSDVEKQKGGPAWGVEGNSLVPAELAGIVESSPYTLDSVFDGSCSTAQVYQKTAQGLIRQVIEGFNSTVFAYGQTSSGKTHTMHGTVEDPGIIPRAVKEIFEQITEAKDREFLLRVSYMELYNEDINDLLAPENSKLQVHEHPQAGVHVAGLREDIVASPEQVLELLAEGERHRHVGETKMNKSSSRSHTIFRMVVESRSTAGGDSDVGAVRVSTLTLVDLAGSERIAKTGAEGQRAKEGAAINKSLLTLGTVINKLSEGVAVTGGHIPYRDSKLTRILQPSLGGNAKTAIICAITPAVQHVEESHSTLRFACRAKRVVNIATVNEVLSDAAVLKRQAREIEDLRRALQTADNASGVSIEQEIARLRAELLRKDQENDFMSSALAAEKEEKERAQRKVESMARMILEKGGGGDGCGTSKARSSRRENRRETWCPGAAERKRPLLPGLLSLDEKKEQEGATDQPASLKDKTSNASLLQQRRSDGGALLSWTSGASPPLKVQRISIDLDNKDADVLGKQSNELIDGDETAASLQARVRELEKANELMQRELDAVAEAARRTQQQLRDAEDELVAVAEERDRLAPQVKEAQWKARQTEKGLAEMAAERDAAVAAVQDLEVALEKAQCSGFGHHDELKAEVEATRAEMARLKSELQVAEAAKAALVEVQAERERLTEKVATAKTAAMEAEQKAREHASEATKARSEKAAADERVAEAETRSRALFEDNERLSAHIADLESRKRAPLYQKRQEDELRAAIESAKDAEIRCAEAELREKEARSALQAVELQASEMKQQLERQLVAATEEVADIKAQAAAAAQRATAEAEMALARHDEAIAEAEAREDAANHAKLQLEQELQDHVAQLEAMRCELETAQVGAAALQSQLDETQACADAAAEHVRFLEEKAEQEAAAAEAEKSTLNERYKEVNRNMEQACEAHAVALASACEEKEALAAVNVALEAAKAELEAKVASVAGALQAVEELKELRRKHKEEVTKLNQALKSATMGSKGTERAADRAAKEADRLKNQVKDLEGKLRAAIAEKSSAHLEKAAAERELRAAREKADKLGKSMNRIASTEERKRESIMVGFNHVKGRVAELEDALADARVDLEKAAFDVQAKAAQCEELQAELEEAQRANSEASTTIEDLNCQLEAQDIEIKELRAAVEEATSNVAARVEELKAAGDKVAALEAQVSGLEASVFELGHEKGALEDILEKMRSELDASAERLAEAEGQLPRIAELTSTLESARAELEAFKIQFDQAAADAHSQAATMQAELASLHSRLEEAQAAAETQKAAADTASAEASKQFSALEKALDEKAAYISSLESQINDAMAEGIEAQAAVKGANQRCTELEMQLMDAREQQSTMRASLEQHVADLQASREEAKTAAVEKEAVEAKAAESAAAIEALERELDTLRSDLIEKEGVATSLQDHLVLLQAELETVRSQQHASEAELATRLKEATDLAEKWQRLADGLQQDQENTRAQAAETDAALASALAVAEALKANLATASQATAEAEARLKEETAALKIQISELRSDVESATAAEHRAQAALTLEHEECARVSAMLQALQQEASVERGALERKAEAAERQIATLNGQVQSLESHLHRAEVELQAQRAKAAAGSTQGVDIAALEQRCRSLEDDLRRSKRREEKLQALQFRLREDLRESGGDMAAFDRLRDTRTLEYELDRTANRAAREKAQLREALAEAQTKAEEAELALARVTSSQYRGKKGGLATMALVDKENVAQ